MGDHEYFAEKGIPGILRKLTEVVFTILIGYIASRDVLPPKKY
tara:strand:+ start:231 stop:359 length:129 start_codon:yes stop_codon:yes gene_type:complete